MTDEHHADQPEQWARELWERARLEYFHGDPLVCRDERAALAIQRAFAEREAVLVARDVAECWRVKAENLSVALKGVIPAIAQMMGRHVDNWPEHKRIKTSIALIDKALAASRDEVVELRAENAKLREALDWAIAEIEGRTRYTPNNIYEAEEQRQNALNFAHQALAQQAEVGHG